MDGGKFFELAATIFTVAATVALMALAVSKKSQTPAVIQSWFSGETNLLGAAEAPVTGSNVRINSSYPTGSLGAGMPNLDLGAPFMGG
jgi:PRD1 phage membrane DNA delivery